MSDLGRLGADIALLIVFNEGQGPSLPSPWAPAIEEAVHPPECSPRKPCGAEEDSQYAKGEGQARQIGLHGIPV